MSKKNITIKELAEILNVSISTVSKALNDSHEIGDKTKLKVKEIAALYNYRPNFIAKSLKDRTTKTIGVVVPDILNYFFVKVLYGIEKEARNRGFKVITCISHESHHIEVENVTTLTNGRVDGLLICPSEETQNTNAYEHIQELIASNIPVITFDRTIDELACAKVISDDFQAAMNATNYFISQGCKSIALFDAHQGLSVMQERAKGYKRSLKDQNLFKEENIFSFDDIENAEPFIREILTERELDAILTIDELLSVKAVKVAQQMGLAVPRDLKVIGFSNGQISKEFHPSISSVDQQAEAMGAMAAAMLIDSIVNQDKIKIETKIVKSSLVQRESS